MKRIIQLSVLILCLSATLAWAVDKPGNELQRKSEWSEPGFVTPSSYPMPFSEFTQKDDANKKKAAISTGYYFYDNLQDPLPAAKIKDIWLPKTANLDTTYQEKFWTRIQPGPRILDPSFWENNRYGKPYFRNPADELAGSIFNKEREDMDTTRNAIAGPMPIGIRSGFYFNGLRYDSFYVSTKGVIGLTNRRYVYDENGNKIIPEGAQHCYDVNSMDWFVNGNPDKYPNATRKRTGNMQGDPSDGIKDLIKDNFGYTSAILGRSPIIYYDLPSNDPMYAKTNGIRNDASAITDISKFTNAGYGSDLCRPALIAPFWGNVLLSQYNSYTEKKEDYGKVYFKYSEMGDSLVVAFYNVSIFGTIQEPPATSYVIIPDARKQEFGYVEWDAKVILSGRDSSVTFIYQRLRGEGKNGATCGDIIRANTISGLLGWARHTNYSTKNPDQAVKTTDYNYPWSDEYIQYTHYFSKWRKDKNDAPYSGTTVIFKQWPNVLRAVDIAYRVRNAATYQNPNLNYTQIVEDVSNYELLAGEPLIGAIQPVCVIQNLSNDIQGPQGVNFIGQDYEFKAQFRLTNSATGRIVYNKSLPVTKKCMSLDNNWLDCYNENGVMIRLVQTMSTTYSLAGTSVYSGASFVAGGFTGVSPYFFVQVQYPAFEPNEFIDHQIGRLRGSIIAQTNLEGQDKWPFDDTLSTDLFVMKRMNEFTESASDYHNDIFTGNALPATNRWVSINADVVDGDKVSLNALAPRGNFRGINSPTIRMNRTRTLANGAQTDLNVPDKTVGTENGGSSTFRGDELRSFPIDLRGRYGAVLSLSVQRGDYDRTTIDRFWAESKLHGPDGKAYINANPYVSWAPGSAGNLYPDMLVVEFAKPSDDGVQGITNIPEGNWRHHPQRRNSLLPTITNVPALTIYGSGGTMVGFLEGDKDSALALPNSGLSQLNALRPDFYDTGVDWDFSKYFVQIPDTFINWKADGARNFRFRLRVLAKNNQINPSTPTLADDYDDFFVDNIQLTVPEEVTDVEVSSVRIDWPYTRIPASQATNIPIVVKISNNTSLTAPVFNVKVKIFRDGDFDKNTKRAKSGKKPLYCRTEGLANLGGSREIEMTMPSWNARKNYDGTNNKYTFVAYVQFPNSDITPSNDTTYSTQEIYFDEYYAYESTFNKDTITGVEYGDNDVPAEIGLVGRGLNVPGSTRGWGITQEDQAGLGIVTDAYAGKIAVKFSIMNTDTIRGYQAMFSSLNSHPDLVEFSLLENQVVNGVDVPSDVLVPGSYFEHERGFFNEVLYFDQYTNYNLEQPIELATGTYWLVVCQTALDGMNLGASGSRSCVKITDFDNAGTPGDVGRNVYVDRSLRIKKGNVYKNNNIFSFLNGYYTTNWVPFVSDIGNIGYPHTACNGTNLKDLTTASYFNGTWVPLLRPFFGVRSYGEGADEYQECPDDVPVTMTSFNGFSKKEGIELNWETSTEVNNYGFEVERREKGNNDWNLVGFVSGSGNSAKHNYYSHLDRNVVAGTTYNYRLRQMDNDGSVSCSNSNVITVTFENGADLMLAQNTPNPFNNMTTIRYTLSEKTNVKLEVMDIFGKTIAVLENGTMSAGEHMSQFSAVGTDGASLPAGTYLYRLTANGEVKTAKMTIIK